jgi:DNA-binding transcriptional LysR family regulator
LTEEGAALVEAAGAVETSVAAFTRRAASLENAIACRCNTVLGLLSAAQSGFGLALLPCHIGDTEDDLVRVIDPLPALTRGLWILTHPDLHKTPKVRAFFDFMIVEIERYGALLLGRSRPSRAGVNRADPPAQASP